MILQLVMRQTLRQSHTQKLLLLGFLGHGYRMATMMIGIIKDKQFYVSGPKLIGPVKDVAVISKM